MIDIDYSNGSLSRNYSFKFLHERHNQQIIQLEERIPILYSDNCFLNQNPETPKGRKFSLTFFDLQSQTSLYLQALFSTAKVSTENFTPLE